jgi:hypothetical protein
VRILPHQPFTRTSTASPWVVGALVALLFAVACSGEIVSQPGTGSSTGAAGSSGTSSGTATGGAGGDIVIVSGNSTGTTSENPCDPTPQYRSCPGGQVVQTEYQYIGGQCELLPYSCPACAIGPALSDTIPPCSFDGGDGANPSDARDAGDADVGLSCIYNGVLHENGTAWPCSDGCNICFCENGHAGAPSVNSDWSCLPDSGFPSCFDNGVIHESGTAWLSADGCNALACNIGVVFSIGSTCGGPPATPCVENGVTHTNAQEWTCGNGCTCECFNGDIAGTLKECAPEAGLDAGL